MRYAPIQTLTLTVLAAAALTACGGGDATSSASNGSAPKFLATTTAASTTQSFFGMRSNFTISKTSTGYRVRDNVNNGGTVDVPETVTTLKFSDLTVSLNMGTIAASIPAADLSSLVELYIAFFNRTPDAEGLAYWIGEFKKGSSLEAIANTFYGIAVSPDFSTLTGYSPNMGNDAFIRIIYKNVLGRDTVDQGGLDYWNGRLNGGTSRGAMVKELLAAAHGTKGTPEYGWVANLLDNKVAVGFRFAVTQALTFNDGSTSYQQGKTLASLVTPTSTEQADKMITNMSTGSSAIEPDNGGSGTGNFGDCFNADLYKTGTTYSIQARTQGVNEAPQETTTVYTVLGTASFKGYNAIETKAESNTPMEAGATMTLRLYSNYDTSKTYGYGSVMTMSVVGYGTTTMTDWSVPGTETPRNLAVNTPFTQTVTNKHETVGPFSQPQADTVETRTVTFLGIETLTVPAGTFSACKVKTETVIDGRKDTSYTWTVASGTYRGLSLKVQEEGLTTMEAVKLTLNGK